MVTAGCLGFLLAAIGGADDARAEPFHYTISGTNLSTTIDTNDDGDPASVLSGEGMSTLGPISVRLLNEFVLELQDPQDPNSFVFCALPDGSLGIQLEQILGTPVFQVRRGDLLTAELVEGTACLSLATCFDAMGQLQAGCIVAGPRRFEITGGTGKLAGASGSIYVESISEILVVSPTGIFTSVVDAAEGEIHIPHGE
jgi:hypothetical protein